jgi:hypothetical protein
MLKTKFKILLLPLIVLFILGKSFVLFHGFSHYNFSNKAELVLDESSFLKTADKHQESQKKSHDCILCNFVNFQNQVLTTSIIALIVSDFLLIFALRFFNRAKLSFLLNSFLSRAPPVIS